MSLEGLASSTRGLIWCLRDDGTRSRRTAEASDAPNGVACMDSACKRTPPAYATSIMRAMFAEDPDRFSRLSFPLGPLLVDFSKNRITPETVGLLVELARARDVGGGRSPPCSRALRSTSLKIAPCFVALRSRATARCRPTAPMSCPMCAPTRERLEDFFRGMSVPGVCTGATGKPHSPYRQHRHRRLASWAR